RADAGGDVAPLDRAEPAGDLHLGGAVRPRPHPRAQVHRLVRVGEEQRLVEHDVADRPAGLAVHVVLCREHRLQVRRGRDERGAVQGVVAEVVRAAGADPGGELAYPVRPGRPRRAQQRAVHAVAGVPASAAMPASKFTGSRRWRSQYSTVPRSAGRATVPVTLETTVILGSPNVTPSRTSRNGSRTGSISGECAATDTPSGVNLTPCAVSCAPTAASAAGSPDSTHCCGEFIEAMARSGRPASSGA